jgi:hypothetical protein
LGKGLVWGICSFLEYMEYSDDMSDPSLNLT